LINVQLSPDLLKTRINGGHGKSAVE